jgi:hypothetical protein
MKETIPVVGKTYHYFDDGKIKVSRRGEVRITEVIPFQKIDKDTLDKWQEEVEACDWLYAPNTDFFVKGQSTLYDGSIRSMIFVRTIYNDWFSLCWIGGRLDIDGSLNDTLKEKDKEFQQGLVNSLKNNTHMKRVDFGKVKYTHVEFNNASIYTILLALVQDSSMEEVCRALEEVKKDWKEN